MASRVRWAINDRIRQLPDLLRLDQKAADLVVRAVDPVFRKQEADLFKTEGTSGGERWKQWSEAYKLRREAWRRRRTSLRKKRKADINQLPAHYQKGAKLPSIGEDKILQLSGDMKHRFTQTGPKHIAEASECEGRWIASFGAESEIAKYHIEGGPHLPIRNPIQRTPAQVRELLEAVKKGLLPWFASRVRVLGRAWKPF